jgi:hypothetical protein
MGVPIAGYFPLEHGAMKKDYVGAFKILGVVGDINFLDYGGTLIVENQGVTEAWNFDPDPDNENQFFLADAIKLERFKLVGDIHTRMDVYVTDHWNNTNFGTPRECAEWWQFEIASICQTSGITAEQFWEFMTSTDPVQRAWGYDAIASYYGWHELMGCESARIEKTSEWRKRLALPCYRARKRGITVYT